MDFRDTQATSGGDDVASDAVEMTKAATKKAARAAKDSRTVDAAYPLTIDASRDALLTEFGKDTLRDRYLLPGES